jgi:hypothetical protein
VRFKIFTTHRRSGPLFGGVGQSAEADMGPILVAINAQAIDLDGACEVLEMFRGKTLQTIAIT